MSVDINVHRRRMGMVFQQFNLFNNKTVIGNIMLARYTSDFRSCAGKNKNIFITTGNLFRRNKSRCTNQLHPAKSGRKRGKTRCGIRRIGLEDKADAYPSTLSGGRNSG